MAIRLITVLSRHCNFSNISVGKERPKWFDRKKCLQNLIETKSDEIDLDIKILFDGIQKSDHYVNDFNIPIININGGTGAKSYLRSIEYAKLLKSKYVYFVEDDYLHRQNWDKILLEGLKEFDYVTLYDHPDKYKKEYKNYKSNVRLTKSVFWKEVPSTTDTFACSIKTLKEDFDIHYDFSNRGHDGSLDHLRFLSLNDKGKRLYSSLPGWSTTVLSNYQSPLYDWKSLVDR